MARRRKRFNFFQVGPYVRVCREGLVIHGPNRPDPAVLISAAFAFELHDTYGFPIELTVEMAAERGVRVDVEGFHRLMAEQRERSRADHRRRLTT